MKTGIVVRALGALLLAAILTPAFAAPSPPKDPSKEAAEAPTPKGPSEGVQPDQKSVAPTGAGGTKGDEGASPATEQAQPTGKGKKK